MSFPPADTPLYNHSLTDIEKWLRSHSCKQDPEQLHCWYIERSNWKAELCLDIDQLTVRYFHVGEAGQDIQRFFKYSLTRQDIEQAVFAGP